MVKQKAPVSNRRRSLLKAAAVTGASQLAFPFIIKARGEEPIKIGLNDTLTGTYADLGKNEKIGCELAVAQINAKGGILGRQVQLLVEDSTSADTGTAVQKAHKLIDRDKVHFLLGNVNSAMALALGEVSNQAGILHVVTDGHTDAVTGSDCHWNVFRVCNTTRMETNSVATTLFQKYGKRWYFLTNDHSLAPVPDRNPWRGIRAGGPPCLCQPHCRGEPAGAARTARAVDDRADLRIVSAFTRAQIKQGPAALRRRAGNARDRPRIAAQPQTPVA